LRLQTDQLGLLAVATTRFARKDIGR